MFELWETWADALLLRDDHPSKAAVDHLYQHMITGVRPSPAYFEEYDRYPEYWERVVEMHKAAKVRGLQTMLVPDWWNSGRDGSQYHAWQYLPQLGVEETVRRMVSRLAAEGAMPEIIEVGNEPNYARNNVDRMTPEQYHEKVQQFIAGATAAGFDGVFACTPSNTEGFHPLQNLFPATGVWEDGVSEPLRFRQSQHSFVLHNPPLSMGRWRSQLQESLNTGWYPEIPIMETEHSSVGTTVDINSNHGAELVEVAIQEYNEAGVPMAWLTMGGTDLPANPRLRTWLVDGRGNFSLGCQKMMLMLAVPPLENGGAGGGQSLDDRIADVVSQLSKKSKRLVLRVARRLRNLER